MLHVNFANLASANYVRYVRDRRLATSIYIFTLVSNSTIVITIVVSRYDVNEIPESFVRYRRYIGKNFLSINVRILSSTTVRLINRIARL